ncbi:MAG: DeoR/GlpR transcriptional regulator [Erysipelotrichia bacterium]|nr:DeoR/GlpR transcriptional regulator [Erysipelotrichia bacterium]NCC54034.1 DeoR/GlpR transcriptional regulator [Erysipelotrichia bacterium]
MLAKERLAYIINRLQVRPSISIHELSKEMNVSFSTVQRDLRKLEVEGKIERSRGGAVSNRVSEMLLNANEIAVSEKIHIHKVEKEKIAKKAAKLIKEGECIFLDSGTTIAHLVPYIMSKAITIVTNSMYLQRKLAGCKGQIFLLGGKYSSKFDMTLGAATIMQLENIRFDRAFLSTSGIDIKSKELYSVESEIAVIKKLILKRTKRSYVLADHSKFAIKAVHTYGKLNDIDYIFTDQYPENERVLKNIVVCE